MYNIVNTNKVSVTRGDERVNKWLHDIRDKREKTQVQVADKSGITERYYQKIEAGYIPPVPTAKRIAEVLNFDWQWFYIDEQEVFSQIDSA